jgi:hypothetical protein
MGLTRVDKPRSIIELPLRRVSGIPDLPVESPDLRPGQLQAGHEHGQGGGVIPGPGG